MSKDQGQAKSSDKAGQVSHPDGGGRHNYPVKPSAAELVNEVGGHDGDHYGAPTPRIPSPPTHDAELKINYAPTPKGTRHSKLGDR